MASCPNCYAEVLSTDSKCAKCGADFTGDGWKPIQSAPAPETWTKPGKPLLIQALMAVSALMVLSSAASLNSIALAVQRQPSVPAFGSLATCIVIIAISIWFFWKFNNGTFRSTLPASLYLWAMLLVYPISNIMRDSGLLLARPIQPHELPAMAVAEILRYGGLLTLIVWVAKSKEFRGYLSSRHNAAL